MVIVSHHPRPASQSHYYDENPGSAYLEKQKITPLNATLVDRLASVANKRLTANLNPLDAILTRKGGGDTKLAPPVDLASIRGAWVKEHASGAVLLRCADQPRLNLCFPRAFSYAFQACIKSIMRMLLRTRHSDGREARPHNAEPHPIEVVPLGRYGGGLLTGHPIGLVIVFGILLLALIGIPEARLFFAGSLVLGSVFGLFLWLRHR